MSDEGETQAKVASAEGEQLSAALSARVGSLERSDAPPEGGPQAVFR